MSTRTVHDPFTGKGVQVSNRHEAQRVSMLARCRCVISGGHCNGPLDENWHYPRYTCSRCGHITHCGTDDWMMTAFVLLALSLGAMIVAVWQFIMRN